MGTLVAKAYPTKLFAKAADHTYVQCKNGGKAWSCWGGKKGGKQISQGVGSTERADRIAQPNERAGIKCYLVNGVCHQAANRILIAAGRTVRNARGYGVSSAIFGTYGRVGFSPCYSPFKRYKNVSGDLSACMPPKSSVRTPSTTTLSDTDKLDWLFVQSVQKLYLEYWDAFRQEPPPFRLAMREAEKFHSRLFRHTLEFELGGMLNREQTNILVRIHREVEKLISELQHEIALENVKPIEYISNMNQLTIGFQNEMANAMTEPEYKALFGLNRGENVVLADPKIVKKVYRVDI